MKFLLSKLFSLLFVAVAIVGCNQSTQDDNSENPNSDVDAPSIVISNVVAHSSSVTFTLTPTNASRIAYCVSADGDYSDLTNVLSSKEQEIKVEGLSKAQQYTIYAIAYSREDVASESAAMDFVTEEMITYPRNVLCYKFTGTWCTNCPYMTNAIDAANEELGGKIIVAAIHYETVSTMQEKFECEDGVALCDEWKISSLPTSIVDLRDNCTQDPDAFVRSYQKSVDSYPSTAQITLGSKVEDGVATIDVAAEFGGSGKYRIGVIITENNIEQTGTEGTFDDLYHHVTRDFLTDIDGDELGTKVLGDAISETYFYTVGDDENVDNMEAIVFITKDYGANDFYVSAVETISLK